MCPNRQETANLVTFTEEILHGNFFFLCSVINPVVLILDMVKYTLSNVKH